MFGLTEVADILYDGARNQGSVPDRLWHYTDSSGLLGIAKSKALWCTDYRFLNDREEIKYFAKRFYPAVAGALREHFSQADLTKIIEFSEMNMIFNTYICSFCSDSDNDEHWFHYGGKAGYSLGFDLAQLRSLAQEQGFALAPVRYCKNALELVEVARAILQDRRSIWENHKSPLDADTKFALSAFMGQIVLSYGPFFKSNYFEFEKEWRLVKMEYNKDKVRFRSSKAFGLISYREFQLIPKAEKDNNVVTQIYIGPGNEAIDFPMWDNPYTLFKANGFTLQAGHSKSNLLFRNLNRRPSKWRYKLSIKLFKWKLYINRIARRIKKIGENMYFMWLSNTSKPLSHSSQASQSSEQSKQ